MYIKVAGAKGHEYVYVCRNYRENGKIKCEHVEKLGRLKDLLKDDPLAVDKLKAKYANMSESIRVQRDQDRLEQTNKKLSSLLSLKEDDTAQSPMPLLCYGLEPLRTLWNKELHFDRLFWNIQSSDSKCHFDLNKAAFYLSALKVLEPRSIADSYASGSRFIGRVLEDISRDDLYATLDFLCAHKERIIKNLNRSVESITNRSHTMMFYDVSNVYFETPLSDEEKELIDDNDENQAAVFVLIDEYLTEHKLTKADITQPDNMSEDELMLYGDDNAPFLTEDGSLIYSKIPYELAGKIRQHLYLRTRGLSKEHRYDLPLISIALVIDENGFPVDYEIYSGCTSEFKTMKTSIDNLKKKYSINDVVVAADRGLNSAENLKMLLDAEYGFLVAQKVSNLPENIRSLMASDEGWNAIDGISKDKYRYRVIDNFEKKYKNNDSEVTITCRLMLNYSEVRANRDKALLEIERQKAMDAVSKGRRIGKASTGWQSLVSPADKKGSIASSFKDDVYQRRLSECGYAAVIYHKAPDSEYELTESELAQAYHHQVKIEECFRILKHNIKLRPVYVWTPNHIRGHVMVCILSLLLFRLMEYRLRQHNLYLSIDDISDVLSGAKLAAGKLNDDIIFTHVNDYLTEAKYANRTDLLNNDLYGKSISEQTPIICRLLEALNMRSPARFNNYSDLNICFNRKFKCGQDYVDERLIGRL